MSRVLKGMVGVIGAVAWALLMAGHSDAQTPQRGGTITIGNLAFANTFDCHQLGSSPALADLAPAYSTLLRFDPDNQPNIIGDLAASWSVSGDRLTYTFKLVPEVHFHDGSVLTSADIKATFDRMRNPPPQITSLRQGLYEAISSIETPDPLTVVFHLSKADPGILLGFASPWGCVYSAKMLAQDPKYPETHIMGTGPFKLDGYSPGTSISYKRFDNYFQAGLPYLDGLKEVLLVGPSYVTAVAGGQVDADFIGMTPAGRDIIRASRGDKTVFPESPSFNITNMLSVNTTKAPLNDVRVRRALLLALDRPTGEKLLQVSTATKGIASLFPAGVNLDMTDDELSKLPGFGPDVAANRAEAKRLLAAAGVHDLQLGLLSRNGGEPWTSLGVYVVDQYRQIGITVNQRIDDTAEYTSSLSGLNFDIAIDVNPTTSSDPTEVLTKFLPHNAQNFTGANDPMLQDLYDRQAIETDLAKRRALVIEFEKRVFDQAYVIPMFRTYAIAAVASNIRGWKMTPSTIQNLDMRSVWLEK